MIAKMLLITVYHILGKKKRREKTGECPKEDLKEIKEGERNRRGMIAGAV